MTELFGYLATACIGISLGFLGAGGSILCVPVMVYLFSIEPLKATSYSLFIVGLSSAVGAFKNYRKNLVRFDVAAIVGIFSIVSVFATKALVVPAIPSKLGMIGHYTIRKSSLCMELFALLMLCASFFMRRKPASEIIPVESKRQKNPLKLSLCGIIVGFISGISGVGGGFLLIPGLVLFAGLAMKEAVATSLFIITMNCLIGFVADPGHFSFDWVFLFRMTALAVAGIFTGNFMGQRMQPQYLQRIFSWLVMLIGSGIMINEFLT